MEEEKSPSKLEGILDVMSGFGAGAAITHFTSLDNVINDKVAHGLISASTKVYDFPWGDYIGGGLVTLSDSGLAGYITFLAVGAVCAEGFRHMNFPTKTIVRFAKYILP